MQSARNEMMKLAAKLYFFHVITFFHGLNLLINHII